jgi:hypothetical protein
VKKLIASFALALTFSSSYAAAPVLSGDVSFDGQTNLYTYTYTLDTTTLTNSTIEVGILQNLGFHFFMPQPVAHTEPNSDWHFVISVGGLHNSDSFNIVGSFWMWEYVPNYSAPPVSDSGPLVFSVTTTRGVNASTDNNYFIFDGGATTGPAEAPGFFEVGHIVGPEFVTINEPVISVLEPDGYLLLLAGMAVIASLAHRRTIVP